MSGRNSLPSQLLVPATAALGHRTRQRILRPQSHESREALSREASGTLATHSRGALAQNADPGACLGLRSDPFTCGRGRARNQRT